MYYDGKYLTAAQKALLVKQFEKFVVGGFDQKHFTKNLYKHLSLHFSFIAHYNQWGFYECRFEDPEGRMQTFKQIIEASRWNFVDDNTSGCADLNKAIRDVCLKHVEDVLHNAHRDNLTALKYQREALDAKISSIEKY